MVELVNMSHRGINTDQPYFQETAETLESDYEGIRKGILVSQKWLNMRK